jgi:hypothetical protein
MPYINEHTFCDKTTVTGRLGDDAGWLNKSKTEGEDKRNQEEKWEKKRKKGWTKRETRLWT